MPETLSRPVSSSQTLNLGAKPDKVVMVDCVRHPGRAVEYFCSPCNVGVCIKCMFADHNGHKLNQLEEAYQQIIESKLQQTEEHFAIAR
jgi:hypothetical protein